ncbi:MAG: hypothetical protein AAFR51_08210 [Pseudomonadota bacterium]
MGERRTSGTFQWTPQIHRRAELLAALGHRDKHIAVVLGCHVRTVQRHLGQVSTRRGLSLHQLARLFERYDAERNIEEAVTAPSGSTEQARLRTSIRARLSTVMAERQSTEKGLNDAQLCADLERLVGRKIQVRDGS